MRALVIEHDPLSTPGRVGRHLERRGVSLESLVVVEDVRHRDVGSTLPDPARYDLVVLMGSPWSVYDPAIRSWIGAELDLIARRHEQGRPMLGICFGAQAMSAALGGVVGPSPRPEYGWGSVEPLVPEIAPGPWFQFHRDRFTLPPAAAELARNPSGLQAFRSGASLAVQFHPEMTEDLLLAWNQAGADRALRQAGVDPDALLEETRRRVEETREPTEMLIDWWLECLVGGRI